MKKLFFGIAAITILSSCAVTKESKAFVRELRQKPKQEKVFHSTEKQPIQKEEIHPLIKEILEEENFIRILEQRQ